MSKSRLKTGPEAVSYLLAQPGMTKHVYLDLRRKMQRLKHIPRDVPPTKGCFVHYLQSKGKEKLLAWTIHVKNKVVRELEKLCSSNDVGYQSLLEMERFQFDQKGPMSPISSSTILDDVIPGIVDNSSKRPAHHGKTELLKHIGMVEKKYKRYMSFGSKNLSSLDFENAWLDLPSGSLRGIPFLGKGKDKDELITKLYGKQLKPVLNQFTQIDSLITTPGLRIQGSKGFEPAKVRLINIPSVNYQYLINGLYKAIKDEMVKLPSMAGWLKPTDRDQAIVKMCRLGESLDLVPIPIDFRKFDSRMFPEFRTGVSHLLLKVFRDCDDLNTISSHLQMIYENQLLCGPSKQSVITFYPTDNLLGSGIANTQADGSTLNAVLQSYLCRTINWEQPSELGLTLGDDAVIWVPKKVIDQYTYEGLLEHWQKHLDPINMEIHVKKKYPLPQVMFLQRLYVPDQDIVGEYSLVRNVDSIVWAEHFRKPIEGIINHMALETIGQIATLNNSMQGTGKVSLRRVAWVVVDEWLKVDKALCYLAQTSSKTKKPADSLFGYLVRASGGIEAIIRAMKLEQYDHKGLLDLFANNSSEAFPIIELIIERALKLPVVTVSLSKVYGLKDSEVENMETASEMVVAEMSDNT